MGFKDPTGILTICNNKAATIKLIIVSHDFAMVKPTLPPGKKMMAPKKTKITF